MSAINKRKQSLYLPEPMLSEMLREAKRHDRSLSWMVQQAWRIARSDLMQLPSVDDTLDAMHKTTQDQKLLH